MNQTVTRVPPLLLVQQLARPRKVHNAPHVWSKADEVFFDALKARSNYVPVTGRVPSEPAMQDLPRVPA